MSGDKDRRRNSATKGMQEYQQLPNESVRVYANRLKGNSEERQPEPYNERTGPIRHGMGGPAACTQDQKSDLGSPQAKTRSRHSTNSSTVRRPRPSDRTTQSPADSNSKVSMEDLRNAARRTETSDPPSPNLRQTLPAIPIIPSPVIQTRSSPIRPVEAAVPTIYSAVAFEASLPEPKHKPAIHSLRQRRPLNRICNLG